MKTMKTISIKSCLPDKKHTREKLQDWGAKAKDWPKKPFDFPYGFLCGQIFVKEQKILDEADYERMVDAPSPQEAFSVLNDTDLADDLSGKNYKEYEQVINGDLRDLKEFYQNYLDRSELMQFLFLRYDVANMKLLAKAVFTDISLNKNLLYEVGLCKPKRLSEYLKDLPEKPSPNDNHYLMQLAKKLSEKKETLSAHQIDIIADRYHYRILSRLTFRIGSKFLQEYLKFKIDTINVFNMVRAFKMNSEKEDLIEQLISGGKLKKKELAKIIKKHPTLEDLEEELVEDWNKSWPTERMEKIEDPQVWEDMLYKKQLHFIEESKRTGCGLGLVLGYFLEKEKAYRRIRQIMKAKIDGQKPHEIKQQVI